MTFWPSHVKSDYFPARFSKRCMVVTTTCYYINRIKVSLHSTFCESSKIPILLGPVNEFSRMSLNSGGRMERQAAPGSTTSSPLQGKPGSLLALFSFSLHGMMPMEGSLKLASSMHTQGCGKESQPSDIRHLSSKAFSKGTQGLGLQCGRAQHAPRPDQNKCIRK